MANTRAEQYVAAIKNIGKKKYAAAYLEYLKTGTTMPEPVPVSSLSYMAAQAVRNRLRSLIK